MRLMAGILSAQTFSSTLTGDASLSRRPMRRVMEPLAQMGARFESADGRPPLTVHGAPLHAIAYRPTLPSAQVKSAVLLAGLYAAGETRVTEPAQTRDHSEQALRAFGAEVRVEGLTIAITGGQRLEARSLTVPGDFSSAAFWMVAAAALPGSRVEIEDVGLNPTRTALVGVLQRFGARVTVRPGDTAVGEPSGTIVVEGDRRGIVEIAPAEVPALIDELPAIAALAAHGGEVRVRGAGELRVKESDRITALVAGFRALGIEAEEQERRLRDWRCRHICAAWRDSRRVRRSPDGDGVRDRGARSRATVVIEGAEAVGDFVSGVFRHALAVGPVKTDKIYLVGFMAAGKTTVARALAKRLDWQAADIDELIERRERQTVAEIFARHGEPTSARAERAVLLEQTQPRHLVVATGAGRLSIRRTAPRSIAMAFRCGSICRSNARSTACRRTGGGRSPPTAPSSSGCINCAGARTNTLTCVSTPRALTRSSNS